MSEAPNNNMAMIKMAEYSPQSYEESENRTGWVAYGRNNDFPLYLAELAMSSPVHGVLCTSISAIIAGKGVTSTDPATDARLKDLDADRTSRLAADDLKRAGIGYLEVIWSTDTKTIAKNTCLPFVNMRLGVSKETGEINSAWYSRNWANITKERNRPVMLPLFNPALKATQPRQVLIISLATFGNEYYPKPDYWPCVNYIELARQIGIYHVNNILNGLFPSFIINFFNGIPDPDAKAEILKYWENKVSGAQNAGKFMLGFNESGVTPPQIDSFPISDADKQYEFLSKETTQQVMIGHRVTTPRLFGVMDSGNGLSSNTDEMKVGLQIFLNQVIEPFQRMISNAFEEILQAESLMGEITIIPNTPIDLTTPEPVQQQLAAEKKKSAPAQLDNEIAAELVGVGHDVDEDWILIDGFRTDEVELTTSTGTAFPNAKSSQDKLIDDKLFISRYRYMGGLSSNSRPFCVKMKAAGKVYRKEDIIRMDDKIVNSGWGPHGADTYSIWLYKGGGYCNHWWEQEIYVSAKGIGIDVNSPNAQDIAKQKARDMGYRIRNDKKVAEPPFDMANYGFLPDNPKT